MTAHVDAAAKAAVLAEALPYIRKFLGKVVVVKYGGNALAAEGDAGGADALASFAADVVLMRSVGMRPVVVHGGGPQIGDLMARLGLDPEFRDGLRVTDAATLEVARMVLVGKVNRDIVTAVNAHGPLALGLSGEDGRLLVVKQRDPALGFVGDVTAVNTELLCGLLDQELIPVIATIGVGDGGQAFNVNADTAAAAIASSLAAEKLVYLTDVEGIRRDVDDPGTRISVLSADEAESLIEAHIVSDGMVPKVRSCVDAVRDGVAVAHILDGRVPQALLLELFTSEGIGTMITEAPQ
ncbi:MAG TPA: acetylglutamate kinase [Acidimicrobiales bacterium]|nr:acetylglutamate kinase [Acidimicrobiales bacterium]